MDTQLKKRFYWNFVFLLHYTDRIPTDTRS